MGLGRPLSRTWFSKGSCYLVSLTYFQVKGGFWRYLYREGAGIEHSAEQVRFIRASTLMFRNGKYVVFCPCDVRKEADLMNLFDVAMNEFGGAQVRGFVPSKFSFVLVGWIFPNMDAAFLNIRS